MSIIVANDFLFILFKDATIKKGYLPIQIMKFQQQNCVEKWILSLLICDNKIREC